MHKKNVVKTMGRLLCVSVIFLFVGLLLPGCKTPRLEPLSNSEPIVVKNGPPDFGSFRAKRLKMFGSGDALQGGQQADFTIYRDDLSLSIVTVRAYFADVVAAGGGEVELENTSESLDSSWFDSGEDFVGSGTYAFSGTQSDLHLTFKLDEVHFDENGPGNTLLIFLVTGTTSAQRGGVIYGVKP